MHLKLALLTFQYQAKLLGRAKLLIYSGLVASLRQATEANAVDESPGHNPLH